MSVESRDLLGEETGESPQQFPGARVLWPRLIELWLAAVLVTFFVIRVLASQTAQRLLGRFTHSHLP
jgi:hypothetical protein